VPPHWQPSADRLGRQDVGRSGNRFGAAIPDRSALDWIDADSIPIDRPDLVLDTVTRGRREMKLLSYSPSTDRAQSHPEGSASMWPCLNKLPLV
jgi:hypothetical protein